MFNSRRINLPSGPSWDAVVLGVFLQLVIGLSVSLASGALGYHHPVLFVWLAGGAVCGFLMIRRIAKMAGAAQKFVSQSWKIEASPGDWWRALRLCIWPVAACHAVVLILWIIVG